MKKRIIALAGGIIGILAGRALLAELSSAKRLAKSVLMSPEHEVENTLRGVVNEFRSRHFESELQSDASLMKTAGRHAEYLSTINEVGHRSESGQGVLERVNTETDSEFEEAIEFVVRLPPTRVLLLAERGRVGMGVLSRGVLNELTDTGHESDVLDESMAAIGTGVVYGNTGDVYAVIITAR